MSRLMVALAAMVLVAGCGPGGSPSAVPPTTAPPATLAVVATTRPEFTAPPATATAEPAATATAAGTPAPTLAPAATAAPTTAAINPLTGQPVDDPASLARPALAVKIAHFPRRVRENQSGLSLADHVWEHYAEGGTTRFTAIFLGQAPERIGNVRSARLIDVHLTHAYRGLLVASGSSTGTMNRLRESGLFERVISEYTGYGGCPILCREESAAVTTDKLFTSAPALWDLAAELDVGPAEDLDGLAFSDEAPPGGEAAPTIHLDFLVNNTVAEWRYDDATHTYARWIDTANMPELAPHVDTLTGQALTAANVVVIYATYTPSNIREAEGGKIYYSYDVLLAGEGAARLFRDGQMYTLRWERDDETSGLPRLVSTSGQAVALRPGVTWFEVVDPDSPTRFEGGVFSLRVKVPPPRVEGTASATPAPMATP